MHLQKSSQLGLPKGDAEIINLPIFGTLVQKKIGGEPMQGLARWLRNEGHLKNVKEKSLAKRLSRFFDKYGNDFAQSEALEMVWELSELEWLYNQDKERFEQARKQEKVLPLPLKSVSEILASMRKTLHLSVSLKRDLLIYAGMQPQAQQTTVNVTQNMQNNVVVTDERLKGLDPQRRQMLLNALNASTKEDDDLDKRFHVSGRSTVQEAKEFDASKIGTTEVIDVESEPVESEEAAQESDPG